MKQEAMRGLPRAGWLLPMAVALFSQLYLYPFDSAFKLAAGVLLLGCASLLLSRGAFLYTAIVSGGLVVLLRVVWDLLHSLSLQESMLRQSPALAFYLIYGVGLFWINMPRFLEPFSPLKAVLALSCCDLLGNLADSLLRDVMTGAMLRTIVAVALLRSGLAMAMGVAYHYHRIHLAEEQKHRRYVEQTIQMAQLRAEMAYLKKSEGEIERVMKAGYDLYERFRQEPEVARSALAIARGIHEVGKDYRRIVAELQAMTKEELSEHILLSEVLLVAQESSEQLFLTWERPPLLAVECSADGAIQGAYSLLSMMSNLIINAAQALEKQEEQGRIVLWAGVLEETLVFTVSDNGCGMAEDLQEDIFLPGFTTKFDPDTGEASAGIGLCHVKNLVQEAGGTITVESTPNKGSRFHITLPQQSEGRKQDGNADADRR